MDDFPGNSRMRGPDEDDSGPKKVNPKADVKKIERVTSKDPSRRKKSLGKRFKETFVGGDARSVWSYVVLDVLIPAAKDMVADAASQGVERLMFGDSIRGRRSSRGRNPNGYVSYNRYSSNSPWRDGPREEPRREMSRRARSSHDFDEIILESRAEAEEVITQLFELVSKYESASVADLYELTGIQGNYTDNKWGWTDIRGAGVTRVRNGYLLDLPRPEHLE